MADCLHGVGRAACLRGVGMELAWLSAARSWQGCLPAWSWHGAGMADCLHGVGRAVCLRGVGMELAWLTACTELAWSWHGCLLHGIWHGCLYAWSWHGFPLAWNLHGVGMAVSMHGVGMVVCLHKAGMDVCLHGVGMEPAWLPACRQLEIHAGTDYSSCNGVASVASRGSYPSTPLQAPNRCSSRPDVEHVSDDIMLFCSKQPLPPVWPRRQHRLVAQRCGPFCVRLFVFVCVCMLVLCDFCFEEFSSSFTLFFLGGGAGGGVV